MQTPVPPCRWRLAFLAICAVLVIALCEPVSAQVRPGTAVVCTYKDQWSTGAPGLFLVPLDGGPMVRVTGLPAELEPSPTSTGGQGAFAVSIRAADGAVIVTTRSGVGSSTGGAVYLFVLHLNGAAVDPARTQKILLGAVGPAPNLGATLHCVLPDGKILVGAGGNSGPLVSGPMAGHVLAIVDTSTVLPTPPVSVLPNPPFGIGPPGGFAPDPTGRYVYWVQTTSQCGPTANAACVQRLELATNVNCITATLSGELVFGVRCEDDGTLYLSSTAVSASPPTHSIYAIGFNDCNPSAVTVVRSAMPLLAAGLDVDRSSGMFVATSGEIRPWVPQTLAGRHLNAVCVIDRTTGAARVIKTAPPGGWGAIGAYGVAVSNAIESYGVSSSTVGAQNHYWFENFPNPGGQPVLGNAGFSLTMRAAPGVPVVTALLLSLGRDSNSVFGIEILVDLNTAVTVLRSGASSVGYTLPIPNVPALRGLVLRAQSVNLEASDELGASRGLEFALR